MPAPLRFGRRQFLRLIGAIGAIGALYSLRSTLVSVFGSQAESVSLSSVKRQLSILQGATSESTTQISICLPLDLKVSVYVLDSLGRKLAPDKINDDSNSNASHRFLTCFFSKLTVGKLYQLIVENDLGEVIESRNFSSLNTKSNKFKAALISCMHDRNTDEQETMWRAVEASKPDVMFFLGDSVYVDSFFKYPDRSHVDPLFFWTRYIDVRTTLYLYQLRTLIPTFATWDDHDTGANNGNRDAPLLAEAQTIFDIAFPRHAIEDVLIRTQGVGSHLKLFNLDIMMMDGRSFRSAKNETIDETLWGSPQESYLNSVLAAANRPVWIMNGTQFFGDYRMTGESFNRVHPKSFERFIENLRNSKAPALLTSGDVHYSEIQKRNKSLVGYPLFEITSSSIHTRSKPSYMAGLNLKRWASNTKFNFVTVDVLVNGNAMNVVVRSIKAGSEVAFEKSFSVARKT